MYPRLDARRLCGTSISWFSQTWDGKTSFLDDCSAYITRELNVSDCLADAFSLTSPFYLESNIRTLATATATGCTKNKPKARVAPAKHVFIPAYTSIEPCNVAGTRASTAQILAHDEALYRREKRFQCTDMWMRYVQSSGCELGMDGQGRSGKGHFTVASLLSRSFL
jgi:hypothetical protein